jgi:segregation and condensation protein A
LEEFQIVLPQFEGPFDLLLFFIERDELDIHDIPISKITNDFLGYIHQMQELNIELASEFILVAATLMRIKAKMLLPRPELDADGNEVDPRDELVQHILEYKKYKGVIKQFTDLEDERMLQEKRGNIVSELKIIAESSGTGDELESLDLYKLLKVYEKVMRRFEIESQEVKHEVVKYPYTIDAQKDFVLSQIQEKKSLKFEEVLMKAKDKVELVYTFLAILELLQLQLVNITLGEGFNNFWLEAKEAQ